MFYCVKKVLQQNTVVLTKKQIVMFKCYQYLINTIEKYSEMEKTDI